MVLFPRSDRFAVVSSYATQAAVAPAVVADGSRVGVESPDEALGSFAQTPSPFGMSHLGRPMRAILLGQTFAVAPVARLSPGKAIVRPGEAKMRRAFEPVEWLVQSGADSHAVGAGRSVRGAKTGLRSS